MMMAATLLSWLCTFSTAHAAEPAVSSDGSICLRVILPASEQEIRSQIDTADKASNLAQAARIIDRQPAGKCEQITYKTGGLVGSLTYISLRCPTENGWKETLVSGDAFESNESEWQLREVEGGTELFYRVRVRVKLPVGQSLVDSQIAQTMKRAVERLEERLSKSR